VQSADPQGWDSDEMRLLQNRVAVVTGAASGLGRGISGALAQRGCDLALVDQDAAGLRETVDRLAGGQADRATVACQPATGRTVSLHVTDVADRGQMEALPEAVLRSHGRVHLLVNNAGVSLAGPLAQLSLDDIEWIVGINFWGVVYGCKLFLPYLAREDEAHIVNIVSDFGLIGFPTKSAYCATKFAVRGFSEAVRAELHGSRIGLTCVYPGPVHTNMMRNARAWDDAKRAAEARFLEERGISLEKVVSRILRGIERNAARVLIGRETHAIDLMKRLCPDRADALIARLQKRLPFI
jgi:short-subunit dehydrogenase